MNKNEVTKLYTNISQCACVEKGESDSREIHAKFKVVCGLNLDIIQKQFEAYNAVAEAKAMEMIHPDMVKFSNQEKMLAEAGGPNLEKNMKKLVKKYMHALDTHEAYEKWLKEEYLLTEADAFELKKWPFADLPEKISGGYILSLREMISDFPEDL